MHVFNSKFTDLGSFMVEEPPQGVIKNEPMFFNSSVEYAYKKGGPITKGFLDSLPSEWEDGVFDSRVHMLMKGWYPAIPGYHHDDVPRSRKDGQPNYENPEYHSEHICGLVNGAICPTQFAVGRAAMPEVPEGQIIYKTWHQHVVKQIEIGALKVVECPSIHLIYFDCHTFHQGRAAIAGGFRWFGRISRHTARTKKITNEIRVNANVYLEFPMEGW